MIAVILAGGSGTRLWPRSRSKRPKHLLNLNGKLTLIQETIKRVAPLSEEIVIVSERSHARTLEAQTAKFKNIKILIEPGRRGTASAIALALNYLRGREETIAVLPADHSISGDQAFRRSIRAASAAAEEGAIVTLGLNPQYPSTGFGYIHIGSSAGKFSGAQVYKVKKFIEKPPLKKAEKYLNDGGYLWNLGMFVGKISTFEKEFSKFLPEHAEFIHDKYVAKRYLALPSETIDYGIIERSVNVLVVPAAFEWTDIGSWSDLHDILERDSDGNVFDGAYVDIDSSNCLIHSGKILVATIGLTDTVVVATEDAVLVMPKSRSQDVKKVVEKLKLEKKTKYL